MTNVEAKMFLDNLKVCIDEHHVVADWLVEIANRKTESNSENPNNCEHITEDGVTCAKYPACDDCLDNPLNKVKGSEKLLKGKEEPQTDKHKCRRCVYYDVSSDYYPCVSCVDYSNYTGEIEDEPQTERRE